MAFSNNLRKLRHDRGMSQDDLAKKLGYKSFTTIQKWESDVSEPTISVVKRIAEIFNVTMDELINVAMVPESEENSPEVMAIVNMLSEESAETQMRVFDVVCDFLSCNEYNQGRIASYANMLAAKGVDTSSADREVDKIKADFYARYDMVAETPSSYGVAPEDIDTMTGRPIVDEIKRVQREAMEKNAPAKKQVK